MNSGIEQKLFTPDISSLLDVENYAKLLRVLAQFHNYTLQNKLLIALQMPEASLLLNYGRWAELHREITPYSNGIRLMAPKYKIKYHYNDTGRPVKVKDMTREELQDSIKLGLVSPVREIASYEQATVYDISETTKELASSTEVPISPWEYDLDTQKLLKAIAKHTKAQIRIDDGPDNAGIYDESSRTLIVMSDGSPENLTKSLIICISQYEASIHNGISDKRAFTSSLQYALYTRLGIVETIKKIEFISKWKSDYTSSTSDKDRVLSDLADIATSISSLLSSIEREYDVSVRFKADEILEDAMREELADDVLSEASANAVQALLSGG